ncbi:MAG: cytochrome c maturation protein CcmE [Rhodoferax sp.]|nr:cytochrome c maturation protein CcmE [Rhodoferax sp.]OIP20025.1 MAG: cytochrome c biogenesis protein CcmE [Comamonadaceae bacterium CG2_30_60_41]PIW10420.1 MAG: cytochrome c maturation protein CcmE [Comamonadaceae bacterium CG17_big_fil_post_rev_8_21_14_2_50_60_13]PIY23584.1 MAG: cytochrome c maturation protein CcmE [Comamonadaceae bacterium CG_4_10_14_3_um_filter_60_75]PJC14394.1 MAG: cytochrome c maturation protein CcmE [Comamonadaceae bacterium CG_4_9_14_0_8_um_filter_60_18]
MKPRHKRAAIIIGGVAAIGVAAYFVLNAFNSSLVFFFTPSQVAKGEAPVNRAFRVGGMVKEGSVKRDNLTVSFVVTDTAKEVPVSYTGILPDLFREGKGVVAQGKLNDTGQFSATEVLAKHDENYMPPEAQHAMDQAQIEKAAQTLK